MNRPYARTAAQDIEATSANVALQLTDLAAKIETLQAQAKIHSKDWGYAESLRKVESDLANLITFVSKS